ncbi:hypothetical protein FJW08_31620 [Mesorhizobium sp. B3-2-1]|nr:hypothetical protein FJW08_31620 [Mesorhizobium sp. B3-2-1]
MTNCGSSDLQSSADAEGLSGPSGVLLSGRLARQQIFSDRGLPRANYQAGIRDEEELAAVSKLPLGR